MGNECCNKTWVGCSLPVFQKDGLNAAIIDDVCVRPAFINT